jgi:choline dehydrogenase-like flavoprotein
MLDGVEVVIDGERIPDHVPLWTLQGRTFTLDELRASTDVRWQLDEPATITVPKPRIHYRLTERDHQTIARARESILRAARSLGEFIGDEPLMLSGGASLHYQGTTRMGATDDGTSVCGPTSEVWGVSGLYVAGNNVIPTPIACNPTLTSVALAVGGARDIAARLAAGSDAVLATATEGK